MVITVFRCRRSPIGTYDVNEFSNPISSEVVDPQGNPAENRSVSDQDNGGGDAAVDIPHNPSTIAEANF